MSLFHSPLDSTHFLTFFLQKGLALQFPQIECENDMQMVSFVLKSGQILPRAQMSEDKT